MAHRQLLPSFVIVVHRPEKVTFVTLRPVIVL